MTAPNISITQQQTAQLQAGSNSSPILFSQLPTASGVIAGTIAYTSDQGTLVSNGLSWYPLGSQPLYGAQPGFNAPNSGGAGTGVFNLTAQNTKQIRAGVARIRAKTGTFKVACIGDSTTMGAYASGVVFNGNKILSWPTQLANILTGLGLPASSDSVIATNNVTPQTMAGYNGYNPLVSASSTMIPNLVPSLGGYGFYSNSVNGANLLFTPAGTFDTVEVIFLQNNPGFGAYQVQVNSVNLGTAQSTNGAVGVVKVNAGTGTRFTNGTTQVSVAATSTSPVYIVGVTVRDSTIPRVEIQNMGASGGWVYNSNPTYQFQSIFSSPTDPANPNQFGFYPGIVAAAPNLTIINTTINDINSQINSIPVYTAQLAAGITQALTVGDVVLMIGNPCNAAGWTGGIVAPLYQNAVYALAQQFNIPLIDITQRWTSYAVTNPIMAYGDAGVGSLHPSSVGYADIAQAVRLLFNV